MTQANLLSGELPDRILTEEELVQAIRLNVATEHEAVHRYLVQAEAVDHPLAKAVLTRIANEKRVHVGELERLLELLTGEENSAIVQGREEVDEIVAELASS